MKMFKSLKNRLLFYFLIANLFAFIGFALLIYETAKKGVSDTLDSQLKILSLDAIADLIDVDGYVNAKEIALELEDEFDIRPLELNILYYDKVLKKVVHHSLSDPALKSHFEVALHEMGHLHSIYYFDKNEYRVSSMLLLEDKQTKIFFQAATKKIITTPYLENLLLNLLITVPLVVLFLLFIANLLLSQSLNPVKSTIDSVNEISVQNLSQRLNAKNAPMEIKALIDTFNALLERLEKSFEQISTFSADASHELKTPLTVIRGEAEVALRKERSPQVYEEVLKTIISESTQVQESIEQLFLLTKKESKELSENFKELYLDEVLDDAIASLKMKAESREVQLRLTALTPLSIHANEHLLKVALSNLIRNAIAYSDKGSMVEISLTLDKDRAVLCIKDQGCGISEEELPFIFDRFYRVEKSRSRKKGGTGLGLAIVKMILDLHHYEIEVQSTLAKGTSVYVYIPK